MKLFDKSYCDGAAKRTRTSTPVKELAPQASASTSSAMAAHSRKPTLAKARRLTNRPGDDKGDGGRRVRFKVMRSTLSIRRIDGGSADGDDETQRRGVFGISQEAP